MELVIDCSTCLGAGTSRCSDCVVTFITSRLPDEALVVDAAEFAALRRLAAAGLVPGLGLEPVEGEPSRSGLADAG